MPAAEPSSFSASRGPETETASKVKEAQERSLHERSKMEVSAALTAEDHSVIIAPFMPFMPAMGESDKVTILSAAQQIPAKKRQAIIQMCLPLVYEGCNSHFIADLIKVVQRTAKKNRKIVTKTALDLMQSKPNFLIKELLIKIVSSSEKTLKDAIDLLHGLPLDYDVDVYDSFLFIRAFQKLNLEDEDRLMIQKYLPLVLGCFIKKANHSNLTNDEIEKLLEVVCSIPKEKRQFILESSKLFIRKDYGYRFKRDLLDLMQQMPECHFGEPLRQIVSLFSDIDSKGMCAVLYAVQGCSSVVTVADLADLHEAFLQYGKDLRKEISEYICDGILYVNPADRIKVMKDFFKTEGSFPILCAWTPLTQGRNRSFPYLENY